MAGHGSPPPPDRAILRLGALDPPPRKGGGIGDDPRLMANWGPLLPDPREGKPTPTNFLDKPRGKGKMGYIPGIGGYQRPGRSIRQRLGG